MKKRSELLFSVAAVPLDAIAILAAFLVSYSVRDESGALSVSSILPYDRFVRISLAVTAVWVVIFALLGLYSLKSTRRGLSEFARVLAGVTIGTLVMIAVIFFARKEFSSRSIIIIGFFTALAFVTLGRILLRASQRAFFRYGVGVRRAIIVGTGQPAQQLADELESHNRGYVVVGFVGDDDVDGLPPLGSLDDLDEILIRLKPDEIIDADPALSSKRKADIINSAEDAHAEMRFLSESVELSTSRVTASAVGGIPILTIQRTPLEGWGRVIKRLTDIVGSLLAIPFILILLPFIALAIKLDSRGPIIYKQARVGKAGREFTSYKFRSMVEDAEIKLKDLKQQNEADGPVFKMRKDPRVTRVGSFLRRTSLDELPQFFNVLKGEMSLVGPRPPLPSEVAQYDRLERRRLTIKPGITGPWQVSGRSDVTFAEWVRLDIYYIQNWSLLLDLTILLKTVAVVVLRRGAY